MDITCKAPLTLAVEGGETDARIRAFAAEHRFTVFRAGPPVWELRRGNPFVAAFTFDLRKVPTTLLADTSENEASIRVRSLLQVATAGDREAVEHELRLLVAHLRGEPPPFAPPRPPSATRRLLLGVAAVPFLVLLVLFAADRWERAPRDEPATADAKFALFEHARRATVLVYGEEEGNPQAWKGSAVVVARHPLCYVALTNAHVLKGASEASLSLQYGKTRLSVVGRTPGRGETPPIRVSHVISQGFTRRGKDLGFLILPKEAPLEECGFASGEPEDGQWVFAVGHPQEERWFSAEGVARDPAARGKVRTIPHTALISNGSSGGGLFDSRGRLLGINTWTGVQSHLVRSDEPIGVAIAVGEVSAACDVRYVEVAADEGWQRTGIRVSRGQMISVAAIGTWRLGGWAGTCGAAGMTGHEGHSFASEHPHGCLLVKDDGPYIRIPELSYARSDGGELQFRINDKDLGNNSGTLGVVVVRWK